MAEDAYKPESIIGRTSYEAEYRRMNAITKVMGIDTLGSHIVRELMTRDIGRFKLNYVAGERNL